MEHFARPQATLISRQLETPIPSGTALHGDENPSCQPNQASRLRPQDQHLPATEDNRMESNFIEAAVENSSFFSSVQRPYKAGSVCAKALVGEFPSWLCFIKSEDVWQCMDTETLLSLSFEIILPSYNPLNLLTLFYSVLWCGKWLLWMQQLSGHHPISSAQLGGSDGQAGLGWSALLSWGALKPGRFPEALLAALSYTLGPRRDQAPAGWFWPHWSRLSQRTLFVRAVIQKCSILKGLLTSVDSQLWTIYSFNPVSKNYSTKNPRGKKACMSESDRPHKLFNL